MNSELFVNVVVVVNFVVVYGSVFGGVVLIIYGFGINVVGVRFVENILVVFKRGRNNEWKCKVWFFLLGKNFYILNLGWG